MRASASRISDSTEEPYYLPRGQRGARCSSGLPRARPAGDAQGPDRLRQDALRRAHGVALGRPLVTVACHDDLSASDLTGRYLIRGGETVWLDGPLTARGPRRRDLLPRRDRRGAAGHDRRASTRSPTTGASCPSTRPASSSSRAPGFQLVDLVQPRLPARDSRTSSRARGSASWRSTSTTRPRTARRPSSSPSRASTTTPPPSWHDRREGAQPAQPRPRGGRQHPPARLCGPADPGRRRADAACEATICKPITDDLEMQRSIVEIIATQF